MSTMTVYRMPDARPRRFQAISTIAGALKMVRESVRKGDIGNVLDNHSAWIINVTVTLKRWIEHTVSTHGSIQ